MICNKIRWKLLIFLQEATIGLYCLSVCQVSHRTSVLDGGTCSKEGRRKKRVWRKARPKSHLCSCLLHLMRKARGSGACSGLTSERKPNQKENQLIIPGRLHKRQGRWPMCWDERRVCSKHSLNRRQLPFSSVSPPPVPNTPLGSWTPLGVKASALKSHPTQELEV